MKARGWRKGFRRLLAPLLAAVCVPAGAFELPSAQDLIVGVRAKASAIGFRASLFRIQWDFNSSLSDRAVRELDLEIGVPRERLEGLRRKIGLQGLTGTCVRYAIAANLAVQGREISGQEAREEAFDVVEGHLANDRRMEKLRQRLEGLDAQLPRSEPWGLENPDAHARVAAVVGALNGTKRAIRSLVENTGMDIHDPELARKLGYVIERPEANMRAREAFTRLLEDGGRWQDFFEASVALRAWIEKALALGVPVTVGVPAGPLTDANGGLHAVTVMGKTRDGKAILYDSNHGLVRFAWKDFFPLEAHRLHLIEQPRYGGGVAAREIGSRIDFGPLGSSGLWDFHSSRASAVKRTLGGKGGEP